MNRDEEVKKALEAELPLPAAVPLKGMVALQVENAALKTLLLRERMSLMQQELAEQMRKQHEAQRDALDELLPEHNANDIARRFGYDIERQALILQA